VLFGLVVAGCLTTGPGRWAEGIPDSRIERVTDRLPPEARRTLLPLSEIFYARIASRRFNSRATFEDPSMRQFFPSVAAYSDYYAALVDALDLAHIRYNRPTSVELLAIDADPSGSLRLSLRFVGANDLPLRFWRAVLLRTDEWRWDDEAERWWVVPGKI
jgi:hypothetical protein